jgi:alkanesulfonate monooxygenase SsuD/methylene tetrahydromethanopterin reductase-like flavin-dependent oxidoreductase (luciferase family)
LQRELDALIPTRIAVSKLEALLGQIDLSGEDPDGPLPALPEAVLAGQNSTRDRVLEQAARGLTISELARQVAGGRTSHTIVGTAEDVADTLIAWEAQGAADGYVISPPFLPAGLEDFVDKVVPILQERGAFRRSYEGVTLRENLGLVVPDNCYEKHPELTVPPEIF